MKKINPERLRTYDLYKILKMTKYSDGGPRGVRVWRVCLGEGGSDTGRQHEGALQWW